MYLHTAFLVSGDIFVFYGSSDSTETVFIVTTSSKRNGLYSYHMFHANKHLHTTVQVISHVFVLYGSSDRSCICILRFKWADLYLYTTVQVSGHVFVYYGWSDQSCICMLRFKWKVMHLYTTVQVSGHVFAYYVQVRVSISDSIIGPVVNVSALSWFIIYITE